MTGENKEQPGNLGRLVSLLKQLLSEEPTADQFAELGESLLATVKAVLSGTNN